MIASFTSSLSAAELHVRGLGWIGNRRAEQQLKLLLGDKSAGTLDASNLEDASLIVISRLTDDGYLEPVIRADITLTDGREVNYPLDAQLEHPLPRPLEASAVTLEVERGRRFTLDEISFTGLVALEPGAARAFFVGDSPLIHVASDRIYSPGRLQRSVGNLADTLRQQGYAQVVVTADEPQIDHSTGRVRVAISVTEGPRWVVRALQYSVADGTPPPDALKLQPLDRSWNALWRQDVSTAIRRWYFSRGHPDVQVALTSQSAPEADGTVGVTVLAAVSPGPLVHVGEVRFTGNPHTKSSILRRLVKSFPGDVLNPVKFDNAAARISRLGAFSAVNLRYDPPTADTRDAVYELTEGRIQEVSLFAGYGSYEQARGGVEWEHYNLFGLAHTSSLKLIESMKSTEGTYTYTVPELFGTTLDGSARVFGLQRQEPSFLHEEFGANASLLWPLHQLAGLTLTTGYTFKHVRDTNNELATQPTDRVQTDVASIDLGLVRERRDNPLRPRKGYKLFFQAELANRALGGEVVYQQFLLAASYHTQWGSSRWIHLGLSHGFVTTFGAPDNSPIPVDVLFYPGGEGSIRGYRKGEAAPRAANGLFVGAKSYVQANLELEQAITTHWSALVFGDALGTATKLADYPFNEELYSVGVGVRYQTIIGPVRVEYGHNLNPRPADPSGTLLVSIGFPF